jgi:peptidoglycan/LPS O-acetylase OafA/YrhL
MSIQPNNAFVDSKRHYIILDGLRGIAAIMVLIFHFLEPFSEGDHTKQIINHGYLAVDFFFLLSGFVLGYAYDDRWQSMTWKQFFKRRLIRLHPMIIMGMTVGAIGFYFSASPILFPKISHTSIGMLLLVYMIGCTLIPAPKSLDIRGWEEMHPLDGPAWSLFFEYLANILYVIILRKLNNKALFVLTIVFAIVLIQFAVTSPNGDIIGGWSVDQLQLRIGFTRLLFPFCCGLLLSRTTKPGNIKNAFIPAGVLLITALSFPRIGGHEKLWENGLYDSLTIIIIFPLIVYIGASSKTISKRIENLCKKLGDISYPLYITHYPIIYIYTSWVVDNKINLSNGWLMMLLGIFIALTIAYTCMKVYDIPIRKWLTTRFLKKNS